MKVTSFVIGIVSMVSPKWSLYKNTNMEKKTQNQRMLLIETGISVA